MSRSLVVKLFWGSLIALVAGFVLMGISAALAFNNHIFTMSGPDVTGIKSSPLSWTLAGLLALAVLILLSPQWRTSWPGSVLC